MIIEIIFRHPDKNKLETAEAKFVEVNKAYQVNLVKFPGVILFKSIPYILKNFNRFYQIQQKESFMTKRVLLMIHLIEIQSTKMLLIALKMVHPFILNMEDLDFSLKCQK